MMLFEIQIIFKHLAQVKLLYLMLKHNFKHRYFFPNKNFKKFETDQVIQFVITFALITLQMV